MTITTSPSVSTQTPPFRGGVWWAAAAAFLVGGLLQLAEFLLEPGSASTTARLDWWLAHPVRMDWSQAAGIAAIPFLLVGAAMMWRLARTDSPRLAVTALLVVAVAMIGLGAVHGIEFAARWAAIGGHDDAAKTILDLQEPRLPGIVTVIMFLPAAVIGNVLMVIALWRSRFVPKLAAIGLVAFVVLDFVASQEVISHAATVVVGAVVGWSIVTGYQRSTPARASFAAD